MTVFLAVLTVVLIVTSAFGYGYWSRQKARKSLLAAPLTEHQLAIVAKQVPLIRRLPADLHKKFCGKVNVFLNQVEFIGCNGLDVTEDMKLSIAAQACILVVNNDTWYDHLSSVLIYPNAFKSRQSERKGYVVNEKETVRTGESWSRGPVILSWAHSQLGAANDSDGHNVVFHEFAHQLDDLSGRINGIPSLKSIEQLKDWAGVFDTAYKAHIRAVEAGRKTFFDPYGASGRQEFFAVTVEEFFEKPKTLKQKEPAVYAQLAKFFRLDPSKWA